MIAEGNGHEALGSSEEGGVAPSTVVENAAVDEVQEFDGAELMGSVASELGIGRVGDVAEGVELSAAEQEPDASEVQEDPNVDKDEEGVEPDSEPSADEEADDAEESEEELSADEVKGLTAEGRSAINQRIGKLVGQRNEARERVDSLEREVGDLREQVERPVRAQVAQVLGVDPMFLAQSERDLSESERHWWDVKRFTEQHMHKEDGFTDERSGRSFSQDQIRARHAEADEMLMRGLPRARQLFEQRKQCMESARAVYPELYKAGSADARVRADALKTIPGLAQLPNADLLIGDMLAGERLRSAADKQADKSNTKVGSKPAVEKVKPARVPVMPAPAKRSPVAKKVFESGSDLDLMGAVISELNI